MHFTGVMFLMTLLKHVRRKKNTPICHSETHLNNLTAIKALSPKCDLDVFGGVPGGVTAPVVFRR